MKNENKIKIIGITGKSGSGKTTFTGMLEKNLNAKVYHLDFILEDLKNSKIMKKIFRIKENKENKLVAKNANFIKNVGIRKFLIEKIIIMWGRKIKKEKIREAIREGREYVIFEGALLGKIVNEEEMNYIFCVERDQKKRIPALIKRDNEKDLRNFADRDIHFFKMNRKIRKYKTIKNDGTIEEFQEMAKKICLEIQGEKGQEKRIDKYRVRGAISRIAGKVKGHSRDIIDRSEDRE